MKFWSDLSNTGLANPQGVPYKDYSNNPGTFTGNFGDYLPVNPLAPNTGFFYVIGSPTSHQNYYIICAINTNFLLGAVSGNVISPSQALAVDTKMDDGIINTGNVSGWDSYNGIRLNYIEDAATHNCINGINYNISNTNNVCGLRIRIGTSIGNLK